jgi:hypothetical protein
MSAAKIDDGEPTMGKPDRARCIKAFIIRASVNESVVHGLQEVQTGGFFGSEIIDSADTTHNSSNSSAWRMGLSA